jgi:hypothetical protein
MSETARPLCKIAREVRKDWANINYAAEPYLRAMQSLNSINEDYGHESARTIVLSFLGNARSWRGDVAKAVKAELKSMLEVNHHV